MYPAVSWPPWIKAWLMAARKDSTSSPAAACGASVSGWGTGANVSVEELSVSVEDGSDRAMAGALAGAAMTVGVVGLESVSRADAFCRRDDSLVGCGFGAAATGAGRGSGTGKHSLQRMTFRRYGSGGFVERRNSLLELFSNGRLRDGLRSRCGSTRAVAQKALIVSARFWCQTVAVWDCRNFHPLPRAAKAGEINPPTAKGAACGPASASPSSRWNRCSCR